jgi:hypothetical protein
VHVIEINRGCNAVFEVMCDHIYFNRIVESNDNTFCIFLAAASLSVCVASCHGGCRRMLQTSGAGSGPLFLFRGRLTKSLSLLLESMSMSIGSSAQLPLSVNVNILHLLPMYCIM